MMMGVSPAGAIGKQIRAFGLARPRIKLRDRGFVGVQDGRLQQPGVQRIDQRLQAQTDHADPLGQRGARSSMPWRWKIASWRYSGR